MNFASPFEVAVEDICLELIMWWFGLWDILESGISFLLRENDGSICHFCQPRMAFIYTFNIA